MLYSRVAMKEANGVTRAVLESFKLGEMQIGAPQRCDDVVRQNVKDYKGIIKFVGYDSPNKKFKDIIAAGGSKLAGLHGPYDAPGTGASQQGLTLHQLQQKENKSIYAVQAQRGPGAPTTGLPPTAAKPPRAGGINADLGDIDDDLREISRPNFGAKPPAGSAKPPPGSKVVKPGSQQSGLLSQLQSKAERSKEILQQQQNREEMRMAGTDLPGNTAAKPLRGPEASDDLVRRLR